MPEFNSPTPTDAKLSPAEYYEKWRLIKDNIARYGVVIGGLSVIIAVVLIFFFLLYSVFPLFIPASATAVSDYEVPRKDLGKTVLLSMEEQNQVGARFTSNGQVIFFDTQAGNVLSVENVNIPPEVKVTSFAEGSPSSGTAFYGLSNGKVIAVKQNYKETFTNNIRKITPSLVFPLGSEPLTLDQSGAAIEAIAGKIADNQTSLVSKSGNQIRLTVFTKKESLFDEDAGLERSDTLVTTDAGLIDGMLVDKDQRRLYLTDTHGGLSAYDISDKNQPALLNRQNVINTDEKITALAFLNGDLSILIGNSKGTVTQWLLVKNEANQTRLQALRSFKVSDQAITGINAEQRRKGFIVTDLSGNMSIFHSTAERELIKAAVSRNSALMAALSPRADAFLLLSGDDKLHFWRVENEYPEVSLKVLWQKIWYESYSQPNFIWQSSSASNDFEPKYSLVPLVFGTLKAAFYSMLFAVPLSLMGAIYTAYFMAPAFRRFVKPTIEMMGALPTVILGFLAGLWLAPFIETNLAGVFTLLLVVPVCVLLFAFAWRCAPKRFTQNLPEGWDAALLIPVILLSSWLAFAISVPIESSMFEGSLRDWLKSEWGIGYDQRNAMIVGIAMGFAVIPSIFSITEDAIFSVPKHLTIGSLALGATPWQTMTKVVLLTASPGIFSAIMIGLGRAVGETMIVLMATGNTPIIDFNLFEGMRTLAANIAVEMPEAEAGSTHYRVLFLAALVLFTFTFVVNTLAEVVRQHLRQKYSSL
ncbi:MAG: phosphate ABC transporter permease [Methylomonas sp.]|nr:MAG: phosphate ABC transporter permease [Methylobacter sp.]PPD36365.1 MAG: phosphate ABC transporter permease [Methylomonas sp.]